MRYQYRCSRCDHTEERNVPVAERDSQTCGMSYTADITAVSGDKDTRITRWVDACHGSMTRQFDPSSLTITVPEGFKQNLGFSLTEPANDEVRKTWDDNQVGGVRWI